MGRRVLAVVVIFAWLVTPGCAHIREHATLRVVALEKPHVRSAEVGRGFVLRGRREGGRVVVQVAATVYCRRDLEQRARGLRVVTRTAVGPSLWMEWITGAVFSGLGTWLLATAAGGGTGPVNGEVVVQHRASQRLYGGGIGLLGGALLTGALVQTLGLGTEEVELGVKRLRRTGPVRRCKLTRATSGRLRLTLDDGLQIEAPVGPDGTARIPLPADLDARIAAAGHRATLEALGDWRSQRRISLAPPAASVPAPRAATPLGPRAP